MLPPLFLLEAGTIRFQEGYSEKGRKGNHLYFSRNVKIAAKTLKILGSVNPAFAYNINRNPILRLLNLLPKRLQLNIIRQVLK